MGGRSKKKSSSSSSGSSASSNMGNAISQVGKATAESTQNMYNSLLGGQLGTIGDTLGGLIENGQNMMSDNPALANFLRAAGGQPMQFETPDFLKEMAAKANPPAPEQPAQVAPQQQEPQWMANMTPEMKQRFYANRSQSPYGFNINNYMRDQNLGGR